jgi:hypothetical protein
MKHDEKCSNGIYAHICIEDLEDMVVENESLMMLKRIRESRESRSKGRHAQLPPLQDSTSDEETAPPVAQKKVVVVEENQNVELSEKKSEEEVTAKIT